jgi:hypothetical protein
MGKKVKVRADAGQIVSSQIGKETPAYSGYSTEQFRWMALADAVSGKEFPLLPEVVHGVKGCVYIRLDGITEVKGGSKVHRLASSVMALPSGLVSEVTETEEEYKVPIESRDLTGSSAWWKQPNHNYDIVRLITMWVDGFMAFTAHKD